MDNNYLKEELREAKRNLYRERERLQEQSGWRVNWNSRWLRTTFCISSWTTKI